MTKVQIKSEKLTPFGGFFSIMEQSDSMLSPVIDSTLSRRCGISFIIRTRNNVESLGSDTLGLTPKFQRVSFASEMKK